MMYMYICDRLCEKVHVSKFSLIFLISPYATPIKKSCITPEITLSTYSALKLRVFL